MRDASGVQYSVRVQPRASSQGFWSKTLDALVPNVLPEPKLCSGLSGIRRFVIQCFVSVASEVSVLFGAARSIHCWICCKRPVSPVPSWPGDDVRVDVLPAAGTSCRSHKTLDAAVSNVLEQGGRRTAATLRRNESEASTVDWGHSNPRVASMTLMPEAGQP